MQILFNFFPNSFKLNWRWYLLLFSLLILQIIPALGGAGLLIIVIKTLQLNWQFIKLSRTNKLILVLTIWLIISSLFAQDKSEALLGLANFLPFFLLFIGIKFIVNQVQQLKKISLAICFPSILIVIFGLGQLYLSWETHPLFYTLTGWELVLNGVPPERMSSVFIHANLLSLYLTSSFILSVGLFLNEYQFNCKLVHFNQEKTKIDWLKIFILLTIIFDLIGLVLTNSRNGWLITFFAIIIFTLYYKFYQLLLILAVMIVSVSWASFGNLPGQKWFRKIIPDFLWLRLSDQMFSDRPLATLRVTQWEFCLDMGINRPIFGWGLRNFSILYKAEYQTYLGHPHNLLLMFMAETGIIGLFLLLTLVGKVLTQGIMSLIYLKESKVNSVIFLSYLICFCGYLIFNLFDVSIFDLRSNTLGWFILACISGISEKIVTENSHK